VKAIIKRIKKRTLTVLTAIKRKEKGRGGRRTFLRWRKSSKSPARATEYQVTARKTAGGKREILKKRPKKKEDLRTAKREGGTIKSSITTQGEP